jgi:hypothetical protein
MYAFESCFVLDIVHGLINTAFAYRSKAVVADSGNDAIRLIELPLTLYHRHVPTSYSTGGGEVLLASPIITVHVRTPLLLLRPFFH